MSFTADFDPLPSISPLPATSRFNTFFDIYDLSLEQETDPEQRTITLVARSPASPAAQALAANLARFHALSLEVGIIFAQIAPAPALNLMLRSLAQETRQAPEDNIRWAKNRALLDAHERLTLGRTLCWTGDSMRRSDDSRTAIDRVDGANPAILAEANTSFAALWRAAMPLPKMLFSSSGLSREEAPGRAEPALDLKMNAEANIVRLDQYLRMRRH